MPSQKDKLIESLPALYKHRKTFSQDRMKMLRNKIGKLPGIESFPALTIFAAGSFARDEASEHSDIDLFFLHDGKKDDIVAPRTLELKCFGKLIEEATDMGFPDFSNDSEYLKIIYTENILASMGSSSDDYMNYFTVRMLLLLESKSLYNDDQYDEVLAKIVRAYFRDFPTHEQSYVPIFLLNDINRFWRTLLLNYEHKRNQDADQKKIKQKVKNYKLKFSRMTTCFATIACIGSFDAPVTEAQVLEIVKLSPRDRLLSIVERVPAAESLIQKLLERYSQFLENTGLTTEGLEAKMGDSTLKVNLFKSAEEYGNDFFELICLLDEQPTKSGRKLLRYLVM